MRKGVTLHIGNTFQQPPPQQQQQPQQHHHVNHQIHQITPPPSGWKSPIPYLFGGLAAMLGLIAFALLILACSYWKLSGYQENANGSEDSSDEKPPKDVNTSAAYMNSILVIMAGDEKPTFLATPATTRASSFGDTDTDSSKASSSGGCDGGGEEEVKETVVVTVGDDKR